MESRWYSRFWLVVNPERIGTHPATFRHDSYESANSEAQRLARENPGHVFHVLGSIECFEKSDLQHHVFTDNPQENDCSVPF